MANPFLSVGSYVFFLKQDVSIKYDEAPFISRLSTSDLYSLFFKGASVTQLQQPHVATAVESYLMSLETNISKV